ncbi:hypothetical protein MMC30_006919 [Trapelia coarctata]|nr:hypothetical protein [Trapelia coarctata]
MSTSKPTVAFFGATGGCTNAALVLALKDGYRCTALARTPSKLTELLISKGISEDTVSTNLRITKGDVKDIRTVKDALVLDDIVVDMIVSGIGMVFGSASDTTVCQAAAHSIVAALDELKPANPPFLTVISSTGISKGPRDVPCVIQPLYRVLLSIPHKDKRIMEDVVVEAARREEEKSKIINGYTIVRPSFLNNKAPSEERSIRSGTEKEPAVGYVISRNDVGKWIFEEVIKEEGKKWASEAVSITN